MDFKWNSFPCAQGRGFYPDRLHIDKPEVPGRAVITESITALDLEPIPLCPSSRCPGRSYRRYLQLLGQFGRKEGPELGSPPSCAAMASHWGREEGQVRL